MPSQLLVASTSDVGRPVKAPLLPVLLALTLSLTAVGLLMPARSSLSLAIAGYVTGAIAAPACVVIYRYKSRAAKRHLYYVVTRHLGWLVLAAMVVGLAAGFVHAWFIATELAKQ